MGEEAPIKSALAFKWTWDVVRDVDGLERRLKERLFYVVRPRSDVIVATSLTNPSMILFVMMCGDEGGDLIVVQNPGGWYSDDDIIEHMPLFEKSAGIKLLKDQA
ncbi:MAG: hypothetical protein DRJ68_02550 [Thermoprotei archaeon]|nr:MAG: hypothetical protein DRJ68_02550 [Thermoprotei archaeon]